MRHVPFFFCIIFYNSLHSQIHQYPYTQNFDAVTAPDLPVGWATTTNRSQSGDFMSATSAYSQPNAVLSTNATIPQYLLSPLFDFSDLEAESLIFFEKRSTTHNSDLVIEASTDGGTIFPFMVGDTLKNPGVTSYVMRSLKLPTSLSNQQSIQLRWRVVGNGTGGSGTIRFDDINVTARTQFDLALIGIHAAFSSGSISIIFTVRNNGRAPSSDFHAKLFRDANNDSFAQLAELVDDTTVSLALPPDESTHVSFDFSGSFHGKQLFIGIIDWDNDRTHSNDTLTQTLDISYPINSLVINEIMYDPLPNKSEYIELYNQGNETVDLSGWKIADKRDTSITSTTHIMTRSPFNLGEGEYVVITADSSLLHQFDYLRDISSHVIVKSNLSGLNNTGDSIILSDQTGRIIDSLFYSPSWHNPEIDDVNGRSLERINPLLPSTDKRNWSSSANFLGGTPGRKNSIFTMTVQTSAALSFSPNPFSPDGDGYEDVTILSYQLTSTVGLIRIRIFDSVGRLVRILANNEPAGAQGEIIWDGMNDNRERVRIGIYIILFETLDSFGKTIEMLKSTVVVATRL